MTDIDHAANGNGSRRALDRLAGLSVPVLLGALGVILWSMLTGVVEGVGDNHSAIIELRAAIEHLTATVNERTGDRWTATQEAQQQALQALIDAAQNEQLADAEEIIRTHQERIDGMAIEVTLGARRLEELVDTLQTR